MKPPFDFATGKLPRLLLLAILLGRIRAATIGHPRTTAQAEFGGDFVSNDSENTGAEGMSRVQKLER